MNNIEAFKTLKGQNVRVKWVRPVKVKKGQTVYFKETSGKFAAGIDYENMVKVQQGRDNGELPSENAGLPWGHWMDFPYLIGHKGKTYVRLYPPSESGRCADPTGPCARSFSSANRIIASSTCSGAGARAS